jgi:teichuronic acid biosynthesis glycosyltransferase TuaC
MTVLVLSHMFPNPRDPGAGIFVLEQIKALRDAGATILVVSPTPWAPRRLRLLPSVRKYSVVPRRSVVDGFVIQHPRVPTLPNRLGFSCSGLLFYLSCRRLVAKLIRQTNIDVLHAHTVLPDGAAAVLLGHEFDLPVICTAHGSDVNVYPFKNRFVRWASQWALRHVDCMVAVSENLKKAAIALAGPREIAVVHNGADSGSFRTMVRRDARSRLKLDSTGKLVCFVGYLRPEKGLEYLLEAFARLSQPDTRLCLVGDGPLKQSLTALAQRLGIIDHCRFLGQRPHDEIPLWISAADCIVLPSLSEGFPTIVPEAMLCGVPIIATPVGGIPEVIRDGETGLLVPCRTPTALSQALRSLLSNQQLASDMAARAQELAKVSLTWAGNATRMLNLYREAIYAFELRNSTHQHRAKVSSISAR